MHIVGREIFLKTKIDLEGVKEKFYAGSTNKLFGFTY